MLRFMDAVEPGQRFWLMALLVLWGVLLFGGFLRGSADPGRRMPRWTRMASSLVLVVAAWSWVLFTRQTAAGGYALFIAIGMFFGFLGDLSLAGLLPGGRSVPGGITAFGIGHVFYIVAVASFAGRIGLDDPSPRWIALLVWLLIGGVGWYVVVGRQRPFTALHGAALPYALLLATTAGMAWGVAWQDGRFIPLALGAALFLLSDLILAGELFAGLSFPQIGDIIWLTYGPGQMLIVYSIGVVLAAGNLS
jgi:hypothetical protein